MKKILTCSAMFLGCLFTASVPKINAQSSYVTRAEAALIILSGIGEDVSVFHNNGTYPDLLEKQWYTGYMISAAKKGMLDADPKNGLLVPHRSVTKGEFLKMITIAYQLPKNLPYQYIDIPPKAWYRPYIGLSYKYKLLQQSSNPLRLDPNALITHRQASDAVQTMLSTFPQLRTISRANMQRVINNRNKPSKNSTVSIAVAKKKNPLQKQSSSTSKHAEPGKIKLNTQTILNNFAAKPKPPPKVSKKSGYITSNMVKQAMIKLLQQNSLIADKTKDDLLAKINEERGSRGLPYLQYNSTLEASAQAFAKDMWKRGYFSHFTPEGESYVDRIRNAGYMRGDPSKCSCRQNPFELKPYLSLPNTNREPNFKLTTIEDDCSCTPKFAVGENIAKGQLTTKQVMKEWMASPPHKKNILRSEFYEVGIGLYGNVWVQDFGRLQY